MNRAEEVVVITSAGGGIGKALLKEAVSRGYRVAGADMNAKALEELTNVAGEDRIWRANMRYWPSPKHSTWSCAKMPITSTSQAIAGRQGVRAANLSAPGRYARDFG